MENLDDRNQTDEQERRSQRRFPISREVKYKRCFPANVLPKPAPAEP
jgi:hypothetical protein